MAKTLSRVERGDLRLMSGSKMGHLLLTTEYKEKHSFADWELLAQEEQGTITDAWT